MQTKSPCPNIVPTKPVHVHSVTEFACQGRGPAVIKLGKRTLITNEAVQAWRRSLEKAA